MYVQLQMTCSLLKNPTGFTCPYVFRWRFLHLNALVQDIQLICSRNVRLPRLFAIFSFKISTIKCLPFVWLVNYEKDKQIVRIYWGNMGISIKFLIYFEWWTFIMTLV